MSGQMNWVVDGLFSRATRRRRRPSPVWSRFGGAKNVIALRRTVDLAPPLLKAYRHSFALSFLEKRNRGPANLRQSPLRILRKNPSFGRRHLFVALVYSLLFSIRRTSLFVAQPLETEEMKRTSCQPDICLPSPQQRRGTRNCFGLAISLPRKCSSISEGRTNSHSTLTGVNRRSLQRQITNPFLRSARYNVFKYSIKSANSPSLNSPRPVTLAGLCGPERAFSRLLPRPSCNSRTRW